MTWLRKIREFFLGREKRYGVRFLRGRFEKLDFPSYQAAEDWAIAHIPTLPRSKRDFVCFEYEPVELAIQPERVVREERITPDSGR